MKGTQPYDKALLEADPARYSAYTSLRGRDERCNWCRMADGRCPDAWQGTLDCPDLDHLLREDEK